MKEDNKLKKFAKDHKLACTIVGGAVIFVAGMGLTYLGFRSITDISAKDFKYLVGKDIETYPVSPTVAEFFGEHAEKLVANSANRIQLDDIVVSSIYNIAKKAET